jgi:WD40 repeat protein
MIIFDFLIKIYYISYRFSPNDTKFASCSDDSFVRIFDFLTGTEERELRGLLLYNLIYNYLSF